MFGAANFLRIEAKPRQDQLAVDIDQHGVKTAHAPAAIIRRPVCRRSRHSATPQGARGVYLPITIITSSL